MTRQRVHEEHESFGTIGFSRASMTEETPLFGSSILHSTGIMLEVHEADRERELSRDWIHPTRLLLRAMLSPNQFVDAITRLNQGLGSPITIEYVKGDESYRQKPPAPQTHSHFDREAEASVGKLVELADELIGASRGSAKRKAEALKQQLESNLPFLRQQLKRQMDQTVTEAKMEFEAHVSARLESLGLEALRERMPRLPGNQESTESVE